MTVLSIDFNDQQIIEKIIQIDQENMRFAWPDKQWLDLCHDGSYIGWYVEDFSSFCLFYKTQHDHVAHLLKIATAKNNRQKGIAGKLLIFAQGELKKLGAQSIFLEVESTNIDGISFYKKHGFTQLRIAKKFYSDGSDALIMIKDRDL